MKTWYSQEEYERLSGFNEAAIKQFMKAWTEDRHYRYMGDELQLNVDMIDWWFFDPDHIVDDVETVLYRHWKGDELLYVGISISVLNRIAGHKKSSWFREIDRITLERYPSKPEALEAEKEAIKSENPKYNVVHNR